MGEINLIPPFFFIQFFPLFFAEPETNGDKVAGEEEEEEEEDSRIIRERERKKN